MRSCIRIFAISDTVLLHMRVTLRSVRHNRAAQIVNLDITDGTCELRLSRSLHSQRFTLGIIFHSTFSIFNSAHRNRQSKFPQKQGPSAFHGPDPVVYLIYFRESIAACACATNRSWIAYTEPRPSTTVVTSKPAFSNSVFQEPSSSPAISLLAWSPATIISGRRTTFL